MPKRGCVVRLRSQDVTSKCELDFFHMKSYFTPIVCSPLDQPKGLRRGFAFLGVQCR